MLTLWRCALSCIVLLRRYMHAQPAVYSRTFYFISSTHTSRVHCVVIGLYSFTQTSPMFSSFMFEGHHPSPACYLRVSCLLPVTCTLPTHFLRVNDTFILPTTRHLYDVCYQVRTTCTLRSRYLNVTCTLTSDLHITCTL